MLTANEIRQQFIDFFVQKHGHTFVPSSSVVPHGDETLMFSNAGMNQFKDVFLGTGTRPYKRAANTQKCIRAGGKHNDLDDVGKDTYHHTFFEMLGNWSFGDYFKKEAISWAWELLTEVWKLDKTRLHVTVFEGDPDNGIPRDDEAADIWHTVAGVPRDHIHYGNKKDNFWEMGETGPCGPCTEVHIDQTPDKSGKNLVNAGTPDVIEIWNLVFIQYNRNPDKTLTPLPAKHVDTGMGFERVVSVVQGKKSNYDTDVFSPLFKAIQELTGAPAYGGVLEDLTDISYRVIADHIRTLTFAITDGAVPDRVGRGYVLRSVLRRAVRYGRQYLKTGKPFLYLLVPVVAEYFGAAFPELKSKTTKVQSIILEEELSFFRTLERGILAFIEAATSAIGTAVAKKDGGKLIKPERSTLDLTESAGKTTIPACSFTLFTDQDGLKTKKFPPTREMQLDFITRECSSTPTINGKAAFDLHTQDGFFIDITEQMAQEAGLKVDKAEFDRLFEEFQETSGKGRKSFVITAVQGDLPKTDDSPKYGLQSIDAKVLGWVIDNKVTREGSLAPGSNVALLLDRTNFYGEQGGQVGDTGTIRSSSGAEFEVVGTQRLGEAVLHIGTLHEGRIAVGDSVSLAPAPSNRTDIMRNHTATHLLNLGLRQILGDHVDQKGSLVDHEKTRFDFSHDKSLTADEVQRLEAFVNERIADDWPVAARVMPLNEAKKLPGLRAVFGEKYPDPVRVVMIGAESPEQVNLEHSVEFCGGTHLNRTGNIGYFKIVSQEGVAKGVRRLTAVTGRAANQQLEKLTKVTQELSEKLNCRVEEIPTRIESMQEELKKLQKQLQKGIAADLNTVGDNLLASAKVINGAKFVVGEVPGAPIEQLQTQVDRLRTKAGSALVILLWRGDEGNGIMVGVTKDLIDRGIKAGEVIKPIAEVAGSKAGGPPTLAKTTVKDPAKIATALAKAIEWGAEQLVGR